MQRSSYGDILCSVAATKLVGELGIWTGTYIPLWREAEKRCKLPMVALTENLRHGLFLIKDAQSRSLPCSPTATQSRSSITHTPKTAEYRRVNLNPLLKILDNETDSFIKMKKEGEK